jgi:hypothetical protein
VKLWFTDIILPGSSSAARGFILAWQRLDAVGNIEAFVLNRA